MPQRPVEEIAKEVVDKWYCETHQLRSFDRRDLETILAAALAAERERSAELEKALSLVMAQVACGNLVRSRPWAIKQVPLVTALAKATAILLREETGE